MKQDNIACRGNESVGCFCQIQTLIKFSCDVSVRYLIVFVIV